MTSFCDVFPDEPDCGVDDTPTTEDTTPSQPSDPAQPEEDNTNTGGDDTEADPETKTEEVEIVTKVVTIDVGPIERAAQINALMAWQANSAVTGHFVYIGVSALMAGLASLYVFRYSSNSTFYDRYLASGHKTTNLYFKWGDTIQAWGGMSLWGLALLSSLFAPIGGVMVDFNMFVWVWGLVVTGSVLNISAFFLKFLEYEDTYVFGNLAIQQNILIDFAVQASVQASAIVILLIYYEDWKYAMWCALSEEDQEAKIAELMADISEMEADMVTEPEAQAEEPPAEEAAPAEGEAVDETADGEPTEDAAPAEGEPESV